MPGNRAVKRRERGFTLMEIMVVIFIIGLLIAVVAPSVLGSQDKAMRQKVLADLSTLEQALDMYRLDNLRFPTSEQGLQALVTAPSDEPHWTGPYLQTKLPQDPWGRNYTYRYPGENGEYDLLSLGKDGQPGGEGENAEVTSWQ